MLRPENWSFWMKRSFLSYFEVTFCHPGVCHRHICLQVLRSSIWNSSLFCLQELIALLLIHGNRISIDATKNSVHSIIEYCRSDHAIFYAFVLHFNSYTCIMKKKNPKYPVVWVLRICKESRKDTKCLLSISKWPKCLLRQLYIYIIYKYYNACF